MHDRGDGGHNQPMPEEHPEHPEHPRLHELAEAAVEAELETGRREPDVETARTHVALRMARMGAGFGVTALGVALLPLPGPGWLVIAAGLVILAQDFVWAERTLSIVRRRLPQDADGRIPRRTWLTIGGVTAISVTASVWWTVLR